MFASVVGRQMALDRYDSIRRVGRHKSDDTAQFTALSYYSRTTANSGLFSLIHSD